MKTNAFQPKASEQPVSLVALPDSPNADLSRQACGAEPVKARFEPGGWVSRGISKLSGPAPVLWQIEEKPSRQR